MMINRLGTNRPHGMMYALLDDVVPIDLSKSLGPGNVQLRPDKRPRPLVLRVNVDDCLTIDFHNYLTPAPASPQQPVTRTASIHVTGLEPAISITDDGFDAGANPDGQVASGGKRTYTLYAPAEGTFLLYSPAGDFNGFGHDAADGRAVRRGERRARRARMVPQPGHRMPTCPGDDHRAERAADHRLRRALPRRAAPGQAGAAHDRRRRDHPLRPHRADHRPEQRPLPGAAGRPSIRACCRIAKRRSARSRRSIRNRSTSCRRFPTTTPAHGTNLAISGGGDGFAINYGASGIVNEILANRLSVGPSADCPECKFEEFFLSSWPNGDPGIVVDVPANLNCVDNWLSNVARPRRRTTRAARRPRPIGAELSTTNCRTPETPRMKATKAFYPDDPSNVYHSYLGDHVIFRVLHAGVVGASRAPSPRASVAVRAPTSPAATISTARRSVPARRSRWSWSTTAPATRT